MAEGRAVQGAPRPVRSVRAKSAREVGNGFVQRRENQGITCGDGLEGGHQAYQGRKRRRDVVDRHAGLNPRESGRQCLEPCFVQERRRLVASHREVPAIEDRDVGTGRRAAPAGGRQQDGDELRCRDGVFVELEPLQIVHREVGGAAQHLVDALCAVGRCPVVVERVGIPRRQDVVVRRHDHPAGRVVGLRQLARRQHPLPLVAAVARHG